jgi:uncharacterized peroxidase-related enzyme
MSNNGSNTTILQHPTTDTEISWLKLPEEENLPKEVQEIFHNLRDRYGFVHNFFRGFALNPEHLLRWFQYYNSVMNTPGQLSPRERELIAVVVSAEVHCECCVVTHQAQLREVVGDPVLVDLVALNYHRANLSQTEQALLDFAVKITRDSYDMSPQDLKPLRELGLTDEAILEAGEIAAQFNFTKRLTKAFGWLANPEYHQLYR